MIGVWASSSFPKADNLSLELFLDLKNPKDYRWGFDTKRALRIELRSTAWKAMVLPLNYARALSGINFSLHYPNISE
jgi:hypothetical protein